MSDVFISYAEQDYKMAEDIYNSCQNLQINTFLAPISLDKGFRWKDEILKRLRNSEWFLFLATENSIKSDAVKHEIGGALTTNKKIIPILYKINFEDLPPWVSDYQGVDIHGNAEELSKVLNQISEKNKSDKVMAGLLIGALAIFLLLGEK